MTTQKSDTEIAAEKAKADEAAAKQAEQVKADAEKEAQRKADEEALAKHEKSEAFKARLKKAQDKERQKVLTELGIQTPEQMAAAQTLLAKHREEEAAKNNGQDTAAKIAALEKENAELKAHFDAEWESTGEELKKLDADLYESVQALSITSREKTKLATTAIKKLAKPAARGASDGINPNVAGKLPDGCADAWKREFPLKSNAGEAPSPVFIKNFCLNKGLDPKQYLPN